MHKVITWNVNSIHKRLDRVLSLLDREKPDVLCLQELKTPDEKMPVDAFQKAGYFLSYFGQKAYNGVAIVSKKNPTLVRKGFEKFENEDARFLSVKIDSISYLTVYVPNGQAVHSAKYEYKLEWMGRLKEHLHSNHKAIDPILLMGDFNVAPEDRDVYSPSEWRDSILFSDPEKSAFGDVMRFGLIDTFRHFHAEGGLYTWWDYRNLSFPFNRGLRIDFVLATKPLIEKCIKSYILRDERKGPSPSDHAPVVAEFEL